MQQAVSSIIPRCSVLVMAGNERHVNRDNNAMQAMQGRLGPNSSVSAAGFNWRIRPIVVKSTADSSRSWMPVGRDDVAAVA